MIPFFNNPLWKEVLPAVQVAEVFIEFVPIGPCNSLMKAKQIIKG